MQTFNKIIEVIYNSIEEINYSLPEDNQIKKSLETVLFGRKGNLDSLGLVNLIIEIEREINESFSKNITIADEKAVSQKNSPFKTVETLANYIYSLIEENKNS